MSERAEVVIREMRDDTTRVIVNGVDLSDWSGSWSVARIDGRDELTFVLPDCRVVFEDEEGLDLAAWERYWSTLTEDDRAAELRKMDEHVQAQVEDAAAAETVLDDGFGGVWVKCDRAGSRCQLEIVRPGKVQCDACDFTGTVSRPARNGGSYPYDEGPFADPTN